MPSYSPVSSVLRGLEVLRQVSLAGTASVKDLHEATGIDKATVVRMLETLIHAGYVRADEGAGGYRATGRTLELSSGYDLAAAAAELAAPVLARFRAEVGWPSDLALRDGEAMILAGTSRGSGPLAFRRRPGFRAPMLETSIGRAYLAWCPEEERASLLEALTRGGPGSESGAETPPDPAAVAALIETTRARGFAVMAESYSRAAYGGTVWAMAVPVEGARLYGALNMMMLHSAVSLEQAQESYLPGLRAAAREIAEAFDAGGLMGAAGSAAGRIAPVERPGREIADG